MLHNNLGGVAGAYCASRPTSSGCVKAEATAPSQLGLGEGSINTYPGCAGKTVIDSCYEGMGAFAPNQRSPRRDWPTSPSISSRACAVFGNVTDPASALRATGTPGVVIDLYLKNTTRYPNWVRGARASPARATASEARTA